MCNSFTICSSEVLEQVLREFSAEPDTPALDGLSAGGTAFPGSLAPVIMGKNGSEVPTSALSVHDLHFGWPVEWKKGTVFNARFDSLLAEKAPWGDALTTSRCIVPCESFHETHRSEMTTSPRTGKPVKRRYRFTSPDGKPLLLAAVCQGDSFSIVTVEPNDDVAPIHDRMPLVLALEEARLWLDPRTPLAHLAPLADRSEASLRPIPEGPPLPQIDQPELPLLCGEDTAR